MKKLDRNNLRKLLQIEEKKFIKDHPKSLELHKRARQSMQAGVPMLWMIRWAGNYPIFVKEAKGVHVTDIDGNSYIDFCLGDTGAMAGHSPDATLEALIKQARKGITLMLPTEDSVWVAENLQQRFGLKYWQFTLTATDANRFAIRMARHITGRNKVLVFNYCYHGSVDETFITLDEMGTPIARPGNLGPPINPLQTTRVIEFNDVPALEATLSNRDVAAVLAEPVMTNIGIIHPEPGFHEALRKVTHKTETLLIIDETHTFCTGPGGYTAKFGLKPDFLTCGKALAGGIPVGVYGFTEAVADAFWTDLERENSDVGGIGGTLAGNALSIAVMRATLEKVLTQEMYTRCEKLADIYEAGVKETIIEFDLAWIIKRLGFRVEYWFRKPAPKNGGEANSAVDSELDRFMHLWALNRGILMTPFHNMALIAESTTEAEVNIHTRIFREAVQALYG
jgi:glutamate-1-semialdehyde 2,1-aminomutase